MTIARHVPDSEAERPAEAASAPVQPHSTVPTPATGARPCLGAGCTKAEIERLRAEQRRLQEQIAEIDRQVVQRQQALQAEAAAHAGGDPEVLQAERHRQDAQRLESLGVLAGGLAHQFNNLLTVISGHVGLAAAEVSPESGLAHSLDEIRHATQRAAGLCRQMLDAAGHTLAARRELEPKAVLDGALALVARREPDRYRLECVPSTAPLPRVLGVGAQLQQALAAVLQNAVEAADVAKGGVRVAVHDLSVDARQAAHLSSPVRPGRYVCFEISDNGGGIAPELLGRIYEPFFTTKGLGRGLGLAVTAGVVRAHHGGIGVESGLGHGSTFRIYLPVHPSVRTGH